MKIFKYNILLDIMKNFKYNILFIKQYITCTTQLYYIELK